MMQAFAMIFKSNLSGHCLFTLLTTLPENSFIYYTVTVQRVLPFKPFDFEVCRHLLGEMRNAV